VVKFIILDNVFDNETVSEFDSLIPVNKVVWHEKSEISIYNKILDICKNHFDLSDFEGYETWYNHKYTPDWHVDKELSIANYAPAHSAKLPICSMVYYPTVENLKGGEFLTKDITLIPKSNRLIMFSSEIYHRVNPFEGVRKALPINPWKEKPMSYQDLLKSKIKKTEIHTV
jgi:hypothetical protein